MRTEKQNIDVFFGLKREHLLFRKRLSREILILDLNTALVSQGHILNTALVSQGHILQTENK